MGAGGQSSGLGPQTRDRLVAGPRRRRCLEKLRRDPAIAALVNPDPRARAPAAEAAPSTRA